MAFRDEREDPVDGVVRGQRAVVDDEVPLEPLGNVVPATARLDHCGQVVHVHDVVKVSRLFQAVEALHLHQLTQELVGHLKFVSQ